jgi:hypothetical protein
VGDLTRQAGDAKPANNLEALPAGSGSDTQSRKDCQSAVRPVRLSAIATNPWQIEGYGEEHGGQQGGQDGEGNRPPRQASDAKPAIDVETLIAAVGALSPAERLRLLEALVGTGQTHGTPPVATAAPGRASPDRRP